MIPFTEKASGHAVVMHYPGVEDRQKHRGSLGRKTVPRSGRSRGRPPPVPAHSLRQRARPHPLSHSDLTSPNSGFTGAVPVGHHCKNFAFPPPPPAGARRIGPRRKS